MIWQEWKKRFESQPVIWATWYHHDGIEEIGSIYESQEAAQLEADWALRRSKRRPRIAPMHIHSLALSQERWSPKKEVAQQNANIQLKEFPD